MVKSNFSKRLLKIPHVRKWYEKHRNRHFCKCGCGGKIKVRPAQYYSGVSSYLRGHAKRPVRYDSESRFWLRVKKVEDGCWEWDGGTWTPKGYGLFRPVIDKGAVVYAHRFSYLLHYGVDPGKFLVCHSCDNPGCVRPDHLFLGDHRVNALDAKRKGRLSTGARHGECIRLGKEKKRRYHGK